MFDIVGNWGGGAGYDIVGAAPVGVPPYGFGFPAGNAFYPANFGGVNVDPYAALAAQQAYAQQAQAQAQAQGQMQATPADQVSGLARFAGNPAALAAMGAGCGFGPLTAPLAVQQNFQPLVGLAPRCPTRSQTQYAGFGTVCIPARSCAKLRTNVCNLMKVIRFVIPSDVAYQVNVQQITVNGKEQLINLGEVSGAMFVEDSTLSETIATETIQPGCCIEIDLYNKSDAQVEVTVSGLIRIFW